MEVVFDVEARREVQEAAAYYEDCREGLGEAFLQAVENGVEQVRSHPLTWHPLKGHFRRYLVSRFPYGIIYALHEKKIYVAAVMHLKRKPDYWRNRTPWGKS
ncbi:MAG: type II toxin-antitoxin system RelE/ParE family toxin [Verrucomicrobiae bacterium]|nr:type II toxin-antitoxin system RelE/ParE family toxin [Verrucomicrobiae bacterium]